MINLSKSQYQQLEHIIADEISLIEIRIKTLKKSAAMSYSVADKDDNGMDSRFCFQQLNFTRDHIRFFNKKLKKLVTLQTSIKARLKQP